MNETRAVLGCVPTVDRVVAERFFDESGGMQLVLHTPFGGRINRAWGLALRKRFCVNFDFELQAAATDDGIVISLTDRHSFPLDTVFSYLHPATVEQDLTQASLAAPMFTNRWRWNAARALAVERFSRGKKVPMQIQRMRAEDLLGAVFPDQVMCQDNRAGPVSLPDHPLTRETMDNCLREAMDVDGFKETLIRLGRGEIATVAVETPAPSPMAHEILNANPYAFLDDAPLEERRARAVALRRTAPDLAQGIGALSPEALAEVKSQAWPDIRDADELHDLLLTVILLPVREAAPWQQYAQELMAARRATVAETVLGDSDPFYVAAERLAEARAVLGDFRMAPAVADPGTANGTAAPDTEDTVTGRDAEDATAAPVGDDALRRVVQGWMEIAGPVTAAGLAARLGLSVEWVERGLAALEVSGVVLQGRFSPGTAPDAPVEWCERRLLSRIHRLTLGRLRREIHPVSATDFIRFLLRWQHVQPGSQLHGRDGIHQVIRQLQGMELPAPAWEQHVLAARMADYDPADLEHLCLAGVVTWGRLRRDTGAPEDDADAARLWDAAPLALRPANGKTRRTTPTRSAPLAFVIREDLPHFLDPEALDWRGLQGLVRRRPGRRRVPGNPRRILSHGHRPWHRASHRAHRTGSVGAGHPRAGDGRRHRGPAHAAHPGAQEKRFQARQPERLGGIGPCPWDAGRCGETKTPAPPTPRQRPWRASSCNATAWSSGNCLPGRPVVRPGACCSRPTAAWRPAARFAAAVSWAASWASSTPCPTPWSPCGACGASPPTPSRSWCPAPTP